MTEPRYPIVGFDGSEADTSLVVLRPGADGGWQVESAVGPDAAAIAQMVEGWLDPPRPVPDHLRRPVDWGDLIAEWLANHIDRPFELTDDQRHMIREWFSRDADGGYQLTGQSLLALHTANVRARP